MEARSLKRRKNVNIRIGLSAAGKRALWAALQTNNCFGEEGRTRKQRHFDEREGCSGVWDEEEVLSKIRNVRDGERVGDSRAEKRQEEPLRGYHLVRIHPHLGLNGHWTGKLLLVSDISL